MRLISDLSLEVAEYIKKCIEWEINTEFGDDSLFISNFLNFVKFKYFKLNIITNQTFEDYKVKPDDIKLRGMFEVCLEIGLTEYPEFRQEFEKRIIELKRIEAKHAKPEQLNLVEKLIVRHDNESDTEKIETIQKYPIIVFWDFSKESEYALNYGIEFSNRIRSQIVLVHFANPGKEYLDAIKKMRSMVEKYQTERGVKLYIKIKEKKGNLTETLENAAEVDARLLFIGSNGYEKHLNIIAGINIPTFIVQDDFKNEIKNVIFPIDDRKEIKRKLIVAQLIHQIYNCKFFITRPEKIAIDAVKQNVLNNQKFCEAFFKKINADFEVYKIDDVNSFIDTTIKGISNLKPDLAIILPIDNTGILGNSIGSDEKKLIEKSLKIPIIFVNKVQSLIPVLGAGVMW